MRQTALVLNSIVIVFFTCFVSYTFVARQHLDALARSFVTEKTLQYSRPIVSAAAESIESPLVQKLLTEDQIAAVRGEIADFQEDPAAYVSDLTRRHVEEAPLEDTNALLEKVARFKAKIRAYYNGTLSALITDLRIFSISNLIAGVIAFALAYRSPEARQPIVWFSCLMLFGVLYCSYLYVDSLTFFRILFRTHLGWGYPALLCIVIAYLYFDFGHHAAATGEGDKGGGANAAS